VANADAPIDLAGLALQLGASFVARSFSGDKQQLVPLVKAAITHRGAAFIDVRAEITVDYAAGELIDVTQHDGSIVRLRKLSADFNPHDRVSSMNYVHAHQARGEVVTGLLYVDPEAHDLHEHFNTSEVPINRLGAKQLSPGAANLAKINNSLR
jgi:2-oxoglutarate ferredoxin oxidoreductase subunit beta